jgi:plasmid stability protein
MAFRRASIATAPSYPPALLRCILKGGTSRLQFAAAIAIDIVISTRGPSMAQLVVRNIEEHVKAALQARARRHRHSLEAEVRDILRNAANAEERPSGGLGSDIAALFKDGGFEEGEIRELRGYTIEPPTFDE